MQHQHSWFPLPFRLQMHRIVITRQAPDAMLGLPGVLCVIGASREKGHEVADTPVHVYGPAGTAEFLSTLYEVGQWWRQAAARSKCVGWLWPLWSTTLGAAGGW